MKASTDTSSCYGVKKCAEVVYNAAKMKKGKGLTVLEEKMKVLDPEQNKIYIPRILNKEINVLPF